MIEHIKKHYLKYIIGIIAIVLVIIDSLYCNIFIDNTKPTLANIISLIIAIFGLWFFYRRIKNQDEQVQQQREQIDIQIEQRVDERFTTAINLLGSNETSARTGAVYSLYQLALDDEKNKYRSQIAQILCSHIRSKTQEEKYKEQHKKRPSNEIQTTIDLLVKDINSNKGLYYNNFAKDENFPNANFNNAYLVGVDFDNAQLQRVDFRDAQLQGANFTDAQLQGANFWNAQLQWAGFIFAQLQRVDFRDAQLQGANFTDAQLQGVNFRDAQLQGADFWHAQLQGADFTKAQLQGAYFTNAQLQGANFRYAQLQGAYFTNAQLQGANFTNAQLQGANFWDTQLQGAYAIDEHHIPLKDRIGKNTELKDICFTGNVDDVEINSIEKAKQYLNDDWYKKMQKIITENKGKDCDNTIPEGIITGVLEDSDELQAIITSDWDKLAKIQKIKNDNHL